MNDPNKRIDVNLSSLLSLKAELLRKHQEVNKAKINQQNTPQPAAAAAPSQRTGHKKSSKSKSKRSNEKSDAAATEAASVTIADTYEDMEMLQKSKRVLEAKSKFYDRMSQSGGALNSDENCLVMFNRKKQTQGPRSRYSSSSSDSTSAGDHGQYDEAEDGEWLEYTDCLGRTRKCLKEDLAENKRKDQELARSVGPPPPAPPSSAQEHEFAAPANKWFVDNKGDAAANSSSDDDKDDTLSMISKSTKADEMRDNWERQETENAGKESIHYQNVLFDEARSHGVGYYAFSTDDAERNKQQRDLETMRQKTLDAQRVRDEQRQAREKVIADRVRAAQNRQRARAGLPPLEDAPPAAAVVEDSAVTKAAAKQAKKARKAAAETAAEAERRAAKRQQHIRPWDKGKDGVRSKSSRKGDDDDEDSDTDDDSDAKDGSKLPTEWAYKPEREPMSQEQWNELQRAERRAEFAPIVDLPVDDMPPTEYGFQARSTTKRTNAGAAAATATATATESSTTHRFNKPFVRRNIPDDVVADKDNDDDEVDYNIAPPGTYDQHQSPPAQRNPEFAPPATFEYYGPTSGKQSRPNTVHLETSIEAGLRFLRQQSDKEAATTKMKWSSNAGY